MAVKSGYYDALENVHKFMANRYPGKDPNLLTLEDVIVYSGRDKKTVMSLFTFKLQKKEKRTTYYTDITTFARELCG